MIIEVMPLAEVIKDKRCQSAWDVNWTNYATACSWHFPDPQNPGHEACHIVYSRISNGYTEDEALQMIVDETANCSGWHDKEARH